MRSHSLDSRLAEDRVVAVPTENLVGEEVEVFMNPKAPAREHLVAVTPYDLYGSRVSKWSSTASARRRDAGPFSGETILSVMNAR